MQRSSTSITKVHSDPIIRRRVDIDELLIKIRRELKVDYGESRVDEHCATVGRGAQPCVVDHVDTGAFLAWIRVGARLLSGESFPSLRTMRNEVTRMVLALTMQRFGTISKASQALMSSRRVFRDNMARTGLYPWPPQRYK